MPKGIEEVISECRSDGEKGKAGWKICLCDIALGRVVPYPFAWNFKGLTVPESVSFVSVVRAAVGHLPCMWKFSMCCPNVASLYILYDVIALWVSEEGFFTWKCGLKLA